MPSWHSSVCLLLLHKALALNQRQPGSVQGLKGKRGFAEEGEQCWDADVWGDTPSPLTVEMCRRSHIHHGNLKTSGTLLSKLHNGECIRVAVLGGSPSTGVCMTCDDGQMNVSDTWPQQFKHWLDTRFPCNGGHIIDTSANLNWCSEVHVGHVNTWKMNPAHDFWSADMVVVESATDDDGAYHGWGDWGLLNKVHLLPFERVRKMTEVLTRELTNHPKKPWLLWAELGWKNSDEELNFTDASAWHLPLLQYYDIDQVSIQDAFLPLTPARKKWVTNHFFADESNPSVLGHKMSAAAIAHAMMHNSHLMNLDVPNRKSFWLPESEVDPLPMELSIKAASVYAHGWADAYNFAEKTSNYHMNADGFSLTEDPNAKGKSGLIGLSPGDKVTIGVELKAMPKMGTATKVHLGFLKSYEHMGIAEISYGIMPGKCSADLLPSAKSVHAERWSTPITS